MSAEIGKLVRLEYPDYDDFSDDELGRKMLERIGRDPDFLSNLLQIRSVYDPNRGKITSWWQQRKSAARESLLIQLAKESKEMFDLLHKQFALEDLLHRQEVERLDRLYRLRHQISAWENTLLGQETVEMQERFNQAQIMSTSVLLKLATDKGMSLPTFLEVTKKIAFDEAEISLREQQALQDIRFAQIAKFMTAHTQIDTLQRKLDDLYTEVYQIANGSEPDEVKRRKTESREKTIRATERDKAQIEKGLLQDHRRETVPRTGKKGRSASDPGSPLQADTE